MGIPTTDVIGNAEQGVTNVLLSTQIGLMTAQLSNLVELVRGGGRILGISEQSLDVLKSVREQIQKAQETVGPIIALVVEVEKIGAIIKGDVGLNLGALVDATRGISDTLKGSIGINIADAIAAGSRDVAGAIAAQTDATKSVGQSVEAASHVQADQTAKIAEAIRSAGFWGKVDHNELVRANAREQVCATPEALSAFLKTLEGTLEFVARELVCIFTALIEPTIKAVDEPVSKLFQGLTKPILDDATRTFNALGQADPNTVAETGSKVLAFAIGKGLEAHLIGALADLVHPTKYTGFPQLTAFLVDIAGFKVVGDAVVGERIRAALRTPARFAAQRQHRPTLPELRETLEAWGKLAISDNDLRELLRFHGIPEAFLPMFFELATREPRVREIALAFEGVEVDDAWLTRALQKAGYRGETVVKLRAGLVAKSNRQHRDALIGELVAHVREGLHDRAWLESYLRVLGFRATSVGLISQHATLAHARSHTNDLAAVWKLKAEQEVITVEEYRLALVGLGYTLDTVSVRVAMVSAKLKGKLAQEEKQEHKSAIRKVQTERTQAVVEAFRNGAITDAQLETQLVSLGILTDQARAMVALERAKQIKKPPAAKTLHEDDTAQEILKVRRDEALTLLHKGAITPDQALAFLVGLGEDPSLAEALVDRELAKLKAPPSLAGLRG